MRGLRKNIPTSKQVVVVFDDPANLESAEETSGTFNNDVREDGIVKAVLEGDPEAVDTGTFSEEAINRGTGIFSPDLMMEKMVTNFSAAKQLYGPKILKLVTGYSEEYLQENLGIPEFRKELKKQIQDKIEKLTDEKILNKDGTLADKAYTLSAVIMAMQELDNAKPKGFFGEKMHKKNSRAGDKEGIGEFKKGQRYRDINVRASVKTAIMRGRNSIDSKDLKMSIRKAKGMITIIYGIDSSASMRGAKIDTAKRAGIALAHKAVLNKDFVGIISFGTEVKEALQPTGNFADIAESISKIKPGSQTNFSAMISKAVELFPKRTGSKHLIIITDALATAGEQPQKETLEAVSNARNSEITISVIGINLDKEGEELAQQICTIGNGRLSIARNNAEINTLVLEEYRAKAEEE